MITSGRTSVGITRTQIDGNDINPVRLFIHNIDSTKDLFIGGEDVTTANGYVLAKAESIEIVVPPAASVYMVSSGSDHPVTWLRIAQY